LLDTIEAISQLNSITEKATVNANLFGRAGIILMDAFKGGSEGVKEFVARMQELGIGLDEQGVRNAERLNDSMFILSKQFNTIKDNLILGFIPVFQDVINGFQRYFHEISKTNGGLDVFAQNIAKRAIDALANFLLATGEVTREIRKLGIRVGISQLKFENFFATIVAYYDDFVRLPFVIGLTSDQIVGLMDVVTGGLGDLVDYNDKIRELEAELQAVDNPMTAVVARLRQLRDTVGENTEAYATLTQFIEQFKNASNQLDLTDQQSALDRFASSLEENGIKLARENMMVKAFNDAETALVDFTETGKLSFKNMVDNMIKELIRLQIRMSIIAPFFEAFQTRGGFGKGGLLAGFGALFGSGTPTPPPSAPKPIPGAFPFEGGGFTGFGARTGGLDGRGGFPAILHPNETVIDHHKGQQVGQQPVNVNFSIQATDASGFDQLLTSRKNQIVAMISQAMNQKGKVGLI
jgi:hypothetical protein